MNIKKSVKLYGLRPEMCLVDSIVRGVFRGHLHACVITSAVREPDGKSLHGVGFAEDYKANHISQHDIKMLILEDLKQALPMCDVLLHGKGDNIHFHVEFDDKKDELFQKDKAYYKKHGTWPE